jgi:hypothetical protein
MDKVVNAITKPGFLPVKLEKAGFVGHTGKRYAATAIARMLGEL